MNIIGAGHAGLIAGAMLPEAQAVLERAPDLPNSVPALMRFRSTALQDATGIQLKRVRVAMAVQPRHGDSPLKAALLYSHRATGHYDPVGRSITRLLGLKVVERYVHTANLAQQLAKRVRAPIHYSTTADRSHLPAISTMPMPALADWLGYAWPRGVAFSSQQEGGYLAWPSRLKGVYATLYTPYDADFTRITVTDGYITAECYDATAWRQLEQDRGNAAVGGVLNYLDPSLPFPAGIEFHQQAPPGKITPVDEAARRAFIRWATREHGVYSLGRYATWRPGLLLDDVVHDVRVIQGLMAGRGHDLIDRYFH